MPQSKRCIECDRMSPIPNTDCHLSDGGIVRYKDDTFECQICNDDRFGDPWNMEFMPDLKAMYYN